MATKALAIALCRVSSTEQLENNSLNRQRDAVLRAAEDLDVLIPSKEYWWSGSVSSKRGTNVNRKDLQEMIDRCKKEKRIKYVIVDEPDRFMRSIDEAAYFEVTFRQLGVTVWYASDPELNKGDLASKLLKFTKYLSAEGSNEERQHKSIAGQTKALMEGRYPFSPKPGYKRGYERAVQEVHPIRGPILRNTLISIVTRRVTPTQALIEFNKTDFTRDHCQYKMDKFRHILTDPFYAGIVEIDKQVKVRNENGLHEALITKDQHLELVRIMNGKKKTQSGPRKNGNPKYPLSNEVRCDLCLKKRNGRIVGLDLTNGRPNSKVYEKYRCRGCHRHITRQELHAQVEQRFRENRMTDEGLEDFLDALNTVWDRQEGLAQQEVNRIKHKIVSLNTSIQEQVEAVTDPTNASIKQDILNVIAKRKVELGELEEQLEKMSRDADTDKERFLRFAIDFVESMGSRFFELTPENRSRCKQLVFPAGFYINANKKVYTTEISPLYRLAGIKKAPRLASEALLVRVVGL